MAWSENARHAFYTRRFGEEEGERRFEEWMDRQDQGASPRQDGSVAPDRPAPRGGGRSAKPKPADVYAAMGTAIYALDTGATWFSPTWAAERLTQEEIGRLAQATGDEVLNSKQLTAWLMRASKSGVHVKLALVVASIAIPRMVNHGMLPAQVATDAADVAGRGAHGDYWPDGLGEVDPDEQVAGDPDALRGAEEQGGLDAVPEEPTYAHGRRNGRSKANEDHLEAALREAIAGVQ
jgi:hypothetical protein